ncbi:MAG: TolC family protein, partial [Acaryochloridaceae cyanobacterium SU_2_1]|nr:TolC family protein [Acaryochloridaceae cyanobacterium SU_2_1]
GGAAQASAEQQSLNAKIAETQFANVRNLVRFQIEQNYFTMQSSFKNIDTNECAVLQANQSLSLARLRSQAGIGTQLEISNAQTDLTRAQSNRLQAIIDYNRSLTALERFVGSRFQQVKPGRIENRDIQNLCPTA